MKRLISLIMALALCLSLMGLAMAAPSPGMGSVLKFDVVRLGKGGMGIGEGDGAPRIIPVHELTLGEDLIHFDIWTAMGDYELDKLLDSRGKGTYFGEVTDEEDRKVNLREELHADKVYIFEFYPVIAYGFAPGFEEAEVIMEFPTYYKEGESVLMLVGSVQASVDGEVSEDWLTYSVVHTDDGLDVEIYEYEPEVLKNHTELIEWVEYPAEVIEDGKIKTCWPEDVVLYTQDHMTLMAIASSGEE